MEIKPFNFLRTPQVLFGPGTLGRVPDMIPDRTAIVLLVTGEASLQKSGRLDELKESFAGLSLKCHHISVQGEPTPEMIDSAVEKFSKENIGQVIAIGGGSAIDAGKAISAMLPLAEPITIYLEGIIGGKKHCGKKIPFIAIPTTAGTGSEATKNAVISKIGKDGFKRSLRHDNFIPDIAIIDPGLMLSCPPGISAACGMDAFTQLLESYVSTGASNLTDQLTLSGLAAIKEGLISSCTTGAGDITARSAMAYAAFLSGITLANAGLGVVHGLASAIGARFDIPHGIICGSLMGEVLRMNIIKLRKSGDHWKSLEKFAHAAHILCEIPENDISSACDALVDKVENITIQLQIPCLGSYGVAKSDISQIISVAENKNNPIYLTPAEIGSIIEKRI